MSGSEKPNEEKEDFRKIICKCAYCRNMDIDSGSALEIDFKSGLLVYVCRNCNKENRLNLQPASSNFPSIGIGTGKNAR